MKTDIKPHNAPDWGLVYKMLNDLCHPSIGSRLTMNTNKIELSEFGGFYTRIINLSFNNSDVIEHYATVVKEDLLKYGEELLLIAYELDKKYINVESKIMSCCQEFIRYFFKDNQSFYKRYILKRFNIYEECICLSGQKFKCCCGNERQW